ncbi:hypothetical protein QN277_008073 [Acacia crassicarpa]|uniref:Chitinase n=1 Tax=Acacia crassicarpa TaxID=499986 RepID=A0AAE1M6V1_9FABA|nr:hypothetical protein QN277_008073 [Acacia crassicarpa]
MSSPIISFFNLVTFQLLLGGITSVLAATEPKLFREYIGAGGKSLTFSDLPINPSVEFHFILSFAIDYTNSTSPPNPTNGDFKPYWDTQNFSPSHVSSIKSLFPNVKVALSLGGDDDEPVQSHYLALWRKYGHFIDYVNFQFYAYSSRTTTPEFMGHFERQVKNYRGGKMLASFGTDDSGGLKPEHGFFEACTEISRHRELHGIFIWSADDSNKFNFSYEIQSQTFLATTI